MNDSLQNKIYDLINGQIEKVKNSIESLFSGEVIVCEDSEYNYEEKTLDMAFSTSGEDMNIHIDYEFGVVNVDCYDMSHEVELIIIQQVEKTL